MALQHTAGGTLLLTASGALADECCCGGPPPPDECAWFLSPDTLAFDCLAQSGSFNINVPTGTDCGWSASVTSGGAFTTITAGFTGNTDGTVEFDLLDNSGVDRTAEITVVTTVDSPLGPAGTVIGVFTINQAECGGFAPGSGGGSPPPPGSTCSWSVGPSSFLFTCFPQGGFFNVNTQLDCGWEAVIFSGGSFITITSGTPGNDAGSVFFTVSANAGAARGGQIYVLTTVVSGYGPIGTLVGIVNIVQNVCPGGGGGAPCSWQATGAWQVGNPCAVEEGRFEVITYAGCGWEAIAQDPWITITSGSTGLSTGTIVFDIAANTTGAARTGTINVYSGSASVLGPPGQLVGIVKIIQDTCAPDSCPEGLAETYSIDSYFNGYLDLTACVDCAPAVGLPVWDGVFTNNEDCTWSGMIVGFAKEISGKEFQNFEGAFDLGLSPGVAWLITFQCGDVGTPINVWIGTKSTGASPVGVYSKTGGCAIGPTTITIV